MGSIETLCKQNIRIYLNFMNLQSGKIWNFYIVKSARSAASGKFIWHFNLCDLPSFSDFLISIEILV